MWGEESGKRSASWCAGFVGTSMRTGFGSTKKSGQGRLISGSVNAVSEEQSTNKRRVRRKALPQEFKKGEVANPAGRPKGVIDRRMRFRMLFTDEEIDNFSRKVMKMAKEGHPVAVRCVMERLQAPLKPLDEPVSLPECKGTPQEQMEYVFDAVANGRITPAQGSILTGMLKDKMAAIEHEEMAQRLEALERLMSAIRGAVDA